MKKLTFLISLTIGLSFGNHLSAQKIFGNPAAVINYLKGEWKWTYSQGGIWGQIYDSAKVGYNVKYIFSPVEGSDDSISYTFLKNDSVVRQAGTRFGFPNGYDWSFNKLYIGYLLGSSGNNLRALYISNDSVWFMDNASDGFDHQFVRISTLYAFKQELPNNPPLIFPNPCHSSFRVNLGSQPGVSQLTLFNLAGQTVKEVNYINDPVDVSGLVPGIYILYIKSGEQVFREKLMIQ